MSNVDFVAYDNLMSEVASSLADRTETVLGEAILSGALAPGSRLALPQLSAAYGLGVTPLREGLSRLAMRGLVTISGNKGFRVAEISRADLLDITESRILVETAALTKAFANPDTGWEDRLVAAMHRLMRVIRTGGTGILEGSPEFDAAHKGFHAAIIGGCGLTRLMAVQSSLYDAAYRYRRIMNSRPVTADHIYMIHRRLADLVLSRDPQAMDELRRHLFTTLEVVYDEHGNRRHT